MRNKLFILSLAFFGIGLLTAQFGIVLGRDKINQSYVINSVSESQNQCIKTGERYKYLSCMTESLRPTVRKYGVKTVIADVKKSLLIDNGKVWFGEDGDERRTCHELMHAIGRSAGKYSNNVKKEILDCDPVCGVGCYHGIMESMLDRTASNFELVVKGFCSGSFENNSPKSKACFHGLGHSIANYRFSEPEALRVCDLVDLSGQSDCAKGAFMELYHVTGLHTPLDIPLDKEAWCSSQSKKYQDVCWQLAGGFHNSIRKNEILISKGIEVDSYEDEAIYFCSIAPEIGLKAQCYELMGLNLYNVVKNDLYEVTDKLGEISKVCHRAVGYVDECIRGSITGMFESDPAGKEGEKICGLLDTSNAYDICMTNVVERRQRFENNI